MLHNTWEDNWIVKFAVFQAFRNWNVWPPKNMNYFNREIRFGQMAESFWPDWHIVTQIFYVYWLKGVQSDHLNDRSFLVRYSNAIVLTDHSINGTTVSACLLWFSSLGIPPCSLPLAITSRTSTRLAAHLKLAGSLPSKWLAHWPRWARDSRP